MDWFLGVIGFEEEELGDDGSGHGLLDFTIEADDALLEVVSGDGGRRRDTSYLEESGKDIICLAVEQLVSRVFSVREGVPLGTALRTGVPATTL